MAFATVKGTRCPLFPVHTPVSKLPLHSGWCAQPPLLHSSPAIQFCIKGHRSAKASASHDQHKGLWVSSLGRPSRALSWVWVGRRRESGGRVNRRLVGDGLLVWGEEAREGGVLTAVEEALRCSMRNFRPIPPPTGQHHSTQLTPAARRPLLAADYNHRVLPSSHLCSLECSNPSSPASGHNPEKSAEVKLLPK